MFNTVYHLRYSQASSSDWSSFYWHFFFLIDYVGMLVTFCDNSNVSSLCNGLLHHCINLHIWHCTFPLTSWLHLQWCSHCSSWLSVSWLFMLTLMSKISAHVCMRVVLGNIKEGLVNTAVQLTWHYYFLLIIYWHNRFNFFLKPKFKLIYMNVASLRAFW
jgi:hypothetical protein